MALNDGEHSKRFALSIEPKLRLDTVISLMVMIGAVATVFFSLKADVAGLQSDLRNLTVQLNRDVESRLDAQTRRLDTLEKDKYDMALRLNTLEIRALDHDSPGRH